MTEDRVTGSRIGVLAADSFRGQEVPRPNECVGDERVASARSGRTSARRRTRSSAPANAYPRRSSRMRGIGKTTPLSPARTAARRFCFRCRSDRSRSAMPGVFTRVVSAPGCKRSRGGRRRSRPERSNQHGSRPSIEYGVSTEPAPTSKQRMPGTGENRGARVPGRETSRGIKRGSGSVPCRPVARARGRGKAGTSDRSPTASDAQRRGAPRCWRWLSGKYRPAGFGCERTPTSGVTGAALPAYTRTGGARPQSAPPATASPVSGSQAELFSRQRPGRCLRRHR
jgi:hypothetical protein